MRQSVLTLAAAVLLVAADDVMETFEWSSRGCGDDFDYCGTLTFCDTGATEYGYRQAGGECISPGPVLRMKPGFDYKMTLSNNVSESETNVHTHGLHISGDGNADDVTRVVTAGNCLDFSYNIPEDHMGGTFWYHAHHHGVTREQVAGGALGMLIIEDDYKALRAPKKVRAFLSNEILLMSVNNGGWEGNGVSGGAMFDVLEDTWYRLRLASADPAGTDSVYTATGECEMRMIARDGVFRTSVPANASTTWSLSGASRMDLAVSCSGAGGELSVAGRRGASDVVANFTVVEGKALHPTPSPYDGPVGTPWVPARPLYLQSLLNETADDTFSVTIGVRDLNGIPWDPETPLMSIEYGDVHDWTINVGGGRRGPAHTFHMHLYHFQIVTSGGCGEYEEGEWYDTVSESCVIRFRAMDVAGRLVLHCHVLAHEDNGAMGWVDVASTNGTHPVQSTDGVEEYTCVECLTSLAPCLEDADCCTGSCRRRNRRRRGNYGASGFCR